MWGSAWHYPDSDQARLNSSEESSFSNFAKLVEMNYHCVENGSLDQSMWVRMLS